MMMAIRTENYDVITIETVYQSSEETKLERAWRYTKYFLKKFIAFLFSHVGLTCMVVMYAMLGGLLFQRIESPYEREMRKIVTSTKQEYLDKMMEYLDNSTTEDIFRKSQWLEHVDSILNEYKVKMHKVTEEKHWDGKFGDEEYQWTFADALLFSVTVITTIGYGHIAPKTTEGKLVTIAYAIFGIPLTMLCLRNIGNLMAVIFRMIYRHTCIKLTYQYIRLKRRRLKKNTFQKLKERGVLLKKWAIRKRSSFLVRVGSINRIHDTGESDDEPCNEDKIRAVHFEPLLRDTEIMQRGHGYRMRSKSLFPAPSSDIGNQNCIYRELAENMERANIYNAQFRRNRHRRTSLAARRNTLCAIQELDAFENEMETPPASADKLLDMENIHAFDFPASLQQFEYIDETDNCPSVRRNSLHLNQMDPLAHRRNSVSMDHLEIPDSVSGSVLSLGDLENEDLVLKQRLKSTREMVPISVVLLLMTGYMILGSMMFSPWEKWDFMTGFYFCFVTLTSIGFGDVVPGTGATDWDSDEKGVLIVLYLLFGMSLLAMSFHLIQEEVKHKFIKVGIKLGLLEDKLNKMLDRIGENT